MVNIILKQCKICGALYYVNQNDKLGFCQRCLESQQVKNKGEKKDE